MRSKLEDLLFEEAGREEVSLGGATACSMPSQQSIQRASLLIQDCHALFEPIVTELYLVQPDDIIPFILLHLENSGTPVEESRFFNWSNDGEWLRQLQLTSIPSDCMVTTEATDFSTGLPVQTF